MNLADIMLIAALLMLVCLALWFLFRRKRRGGCSDCSGCSKANSCPIEKEGGRKKF